MGELFLAIFERLDNYYFIKYGEIRIIDCSAGNRQLRSHQSAVLCFSHSPTQKACSEPTLSAGLNSQTHVKYCSQRRWTHRRRKHCRDIRQSSSSVRYARNGRLRNQGQGSGCAPRSQPAPRLWCRRIYLRSEVLAASRVEERS